MKRILVYSIVWMCCTLPLSGQNFFVIGGTIHTGNGEVIENGAIIVEDGIIVSIADARTIKIDPSFGTVIEAYGKHIYPGLIATNTTLGLTEVDYIRPTIDYNELGDFTPNVRSLIAFNTDSEVIPTVRSCGVLYNQMIPKGGFISGTSSVVSLTGWNWEDAVVVEDDGVHLWWPAKFIEGGWWAAPGDIEPEEAYDKDIQKIEDFLLRAKAYVEDDPLETDIVLEAMRGVFDGTQNLYINAHGARELATAIRMTDPLEIPKRVIVGGREALEVASLLNERDIPVMVSSLFKLPSLRHEDLDQWFKLPAELRDAGIRFCISFTGRSSVYYGSWEQRNLAFMAGISAAYGLSKEEALAAVTSSAAAILGAADIGSIEVGKKASFLICAGDLLDMRTSIVEQAFLNGLPVDLDDKQKALYRKFRQKYVEEGKLE